MIVLLSIKPKYVEKIVEGNKRYEFRKSVFKKSVDEVWIYSSNPIKKIVASFVIDEIIKDKPKNLWENFKEYSGITKQEFFNYFFGKEVGFAVEINGVKIFKKPIDPKMIFPNFSPPQSFYYLDNNLIENLEIKYRN